MHQRLIQRLLLWVAFATALLFARRASASLVPVCDDLPLSRTPIDWLTTLATSAEMCAAARVDHASATDEVEDIRVAAMCDDRGASVVAPARVLPIVDARIDVGFGCGPGMELDGVWAAPGTDPSPLMRSDVAPANYGWLVGSLEVPPVRIILGPPYIAVAGEARAGVRRGIERPPR